MVLVLVLVLVVVLWIQSGEIGLAAFDGRPEGGADGVSDGVVDGAAVGRHVRREGHGTEERVRAQKA